MTRAWLALLAAGCVTPLSNRIDVGNEAFVVVVADGADGNVDLFAAPAEGGAFRQLTYSRVAEDVPRLGPTGTLLAFVRSGSEADGPGATGHVVVMDLTRGTEIEGALPAEAGQVTRLGWTSSGDTLIARAGDGRWVAPITTPLRWTRAPGPAAPALDSLLAERLGDPPFATVAPCGTGSGLCLVTTRAEETPLDPRATDACRWGPDAVGYLVDGKIEVRPLGGGRLRQPTWTSTPAHLRHPTHHPGSPR